MAEISVLYRHISRSRSRLGKPHLVFQPDEVESKKKKLTLARLVGRSNNGRSLVVPPPACLGILVVLRQCFDSIAVYLSSVFCLQSLGSSLRTMFQLPSPFFFFLFSSFFAHIHHLARLSRYFEDSRRLRRAADSCSCPPARLALSYVIIITYY